MFLNHGDVAPFDLGGFMFRAPRKLAIDKIVLFLLHDCELCSVYEPDKRIRVVSAPTDVGGEVLVGPLWVGALMAWIDLSEGETRAYRMLVMQEIAVKHDQSLLDQIEVVWRLGGKPALFDLLRRLY